MYSQWRRKIQGLFAEEIHKTSPGHQICAYYPTIVISVLMTEGNINIISVNLSPFFKHSNIQPMPISLLIIIRHNTNIYFKFGVQNLAISDVTQKIYVPNKNI
jgi:hypothetical protein